MLEDLISFDLCGKTAHFRKFYSNSSALTHTIPPRTTILGIIAAIIGEAKDTYYDSLDVLLIGVQSITRGRKIFQKFNYLKIGDSERGNFDLYAGIADNRTQTSVELIIPDNIRNTDLCYRIFVGTENLKDEKYLKLKDSLQNGYCEYGISLGSAHLLGYITNYQNHKNFSKLVNENTISVSSAILVSKVLRILSKDINLEQDIFPLRMKINSTSSDKNITRIATDVQPMLFSLDGNCFEVELREKENIYTVKDNDLMINIALI